MEAPRGLDESEAARLGRKRPDSGYALPGFWDGRTTYRPLSARRASEARQTTKPDGLSYSLAPAAVYEHVSAIAMNIVVRYPALVRLRWHLPTSGVPLIRVAIPLMIPVNPNVIPAGRGPSVLDDGYWWTKTNYNVGSRCAESHRTGENNSDQPFMKHSFPFLVTYRTPSRNSAKPAAYFNSSP
jgi:hypothetical protein